MAGKAAALMHSLAGHQALVDGNKRIAFLAAPGRCLTRVTGPAPGRPGRGTGAGHSR
jgi:hypothetical protein